MTAHSDDLSSASADRNADRMMHTLHHSSRRANVPRMALPVSARETSAETDEPTEVVEEAYESEVVKTADRVVDATVDKLSVAARGFAGALVNADPNALSDVLTPEEQRQLQHHLVAGKHTVLRTIHLYPVECVAAAVVLSSALGALLMKQSLVKAHPECAFKGSDEPSFGDRLSRGSRKVIDRMLEYV